MTHTMCQCLLSQDLQLSCVFGMQTTPISVYAFSLIARRYVGCQQRYACLEGPGRNFLGKRATAVALKFDKLLARQVCFVAYSMEDVMNQVLLEYDLALTNSNRHKMCVEKHIKCRAVRVSHSRCSMYFKCATEQVEPIFSFSHFAKDDSLFVFLLQVQQTYNVYYIGVFTCLS